MALNGARRGPSRRSAGFGAFRPTRCAALRTFFLPTVSPREKVAMDLAHAGLHLACTATGRVIRSGRDSPPAAHLAADRRSLPASCCHRRRWGARPRVMGRERARPGRGAGPEGGRDHPREEPRRAARCALDVGLRDRVSSARVHPPRRRQDLRARSRRALQRRSREGRRRHPPRTRGLSRVRDRDGTAVRAAPRGPPNDEGRRGSEGVRRSWRFSRVTRVDADRGPGGAAFGVEAWRMRGLHHDARRPRRRSRGRRAGGRCARPRHEQAPRARATQARLLRFAQCRVRVSV